MLSIILEILMCSAAMTLTPLSSVKSGYKWHVGNGRSVRFGEDIWFGNSPLATQFWDIYCVVNETNKTV